MASEARQYIGLTEQDIDLLETLQKAGAATPMELEIKTGRIGDNLEAQLDRLLERGLVEARETQGGFENHIYLVSRTGRKIIS
jgi:predicted transcriptional regulator